MSALQHGSDGDRMGRMDWVDWMDGRTGWAGGHRTGRTLDRAMAMLEWLFSRCALLHASLGALCQRSKKAV